MPCPADLYLGQVDHDPSDVWNVLVSVAPRPFSLAYAVAKQDVGAPSETASFCWASFESARRDATAKNATCPPVQVETPT